MWEIFVLIVKIRKQKGRILNSLIDKNKDEIKIKFRKLPLKKLGIVLACGLSLFSYCWSQQKDLNINSKLNMQFNIYDRSLNLESPSAKNQDDMCVWVHPKDASKSTIISADKTAKILFSYDLEGNLIQSIPVSRPGNIDVRYDFPLNGENVDIVAFNDRGTNIVQIYKVDPHDRKLTRVDDENIKTGVNYGFTLYISPASQKYYAFVSAYPHNDNKIWQFELSDNGSGKISGILVRSFDIIDYQTVEGMVADDEKGNLYIAEEGIGIRKYNAEPDGGIEGVLIRSIAEDPLERDVEGITIYYLQNGKGYIIASSQRDGDGFTNHYDIFEREIPHKYVSSFMLKNVGSTDGIDICSYYLDSNFSNGIFLAHNGSERNQIVVVDWGVIAQGEGLSIVTKYRNPIK